MIYTHSKTQSWLRKAICGFICFSFILTSVLPPSYAQLVSGTLNLPPVGTKISLTSRYIPAQIQGLSLHPENPLMFDFIVDEGESGLQGEGLRAESLKLIKYFMASLTVPENEMWVNLSPNEKNRIIPQALGSTELGRDLLAQDYLLKQLAASLMGSLLEEKAGSGKLGEGSKREENKLLNKNVLENISPSSPSSSNSSLFPLLSSDFLSRIWIVPDKAVVYEHNNSAFVVESHLRVMLQEDITRSPDSIGKIQEKSGKVMSEEDWNSEGRLKWEDGRKDENSSGTSLHASPFTDKFLSAIEHEVNTGKNFATLRQIYNSMILAVWFKTNLKQTLLGQVYADKNKTTGVDLEDKNIKQKIYDQYLESFKKGVYEAVKEEYDPVTQEIIPRKYFTGGMVGIDHAMIVRKSDADMTPSDMAALSRTDKKHIVTINAVEAGNGADQKQIAKLANGAGEEDAAMTAEAPTKTNWSTQDIQTGKPWIEWLKSTGLPLLRSYNPDQDFRKRYTIQVGIILSLFTPLNSIKPMSVNGQAYSLRADFMSLQPDIPFDSTPDLEGIAKVLDYLTKENAFKDLLRILAITLIQWEEEPQRLMRNLEILMKLPKAFEIIKTVIPFLTTHISEIKPHAVDKDAALGLSYIDSRILNIIIPWLAKYIADPNNQKELNKKVTRAKLNGSRPITGLVHAQWLIAWSLKKEFYPDTGIPVDDFVFVPERDQQATRSQMIQSLGGILGKDKAQKLILELINKDWRGYGLPNPWVMHDKTFTEFEKYLLTTFDPPQSSDYQQRLTDYSDTLIEDFVALGGSRLKIDFETAVAKRYSALQTNPAILILDDATLQSLARQAQEDTLALPQFASHRAELESVDAAMIGKFDTKEPHQEQVDKNIDLSQYTIRIPNAIWVPIEIEVIYGPDGPLKFDSTEAQAQIELDIKRGFLRRENGKLEALAMRNPEIASVGRTIHNRSISSQLTNEEISAGVWTRVVKGSGLNRFGIIYGYDNTEDITQKFRGGELRNFVEYAVNKNFELKRAYRQALEDKDPVVLNIRDTYGIFEPPIYRPIYRFKPLKIPINSASGIDYLSPREYFENLNIPKEKVEELERDQVLFIYDVPANERILSEKDDKIPSPNKIMSLFAENDNERILEIFIARLVLMTHLVHKYLGNSLESPYNNMMSGKDTTITGHFVDYDQIRSPKEKGRYQIADHDELKSTALKFALSFLGLNYETVETTIAKTYFNLFFPRINKFQNEPNEFINFISEFIIYSKLNSFPPMLEIIDDLKNGENLDLITSKLIRILGSGIENLNKLIRDTSNTNTSLQSRYSQRIEYYKKMKSEAKTIIAMIALFNGQYDDRFSDPSNVPDAAMLADSSDSLRFMGGDGFSAADAFDSIIKDRSTNQRPGTTTRRFGFEFEAQVVDQFPDLQRGEKYPAEVWQVKAKQYFDRLYEALPSRWGRDRFVPSANFHEFKTPPSDGLPDDDESWKELTDTLRDIQRPDGALPGGIFSIHGHFSDSRIPRNRETNKLEIDHERLGRVVKAYEALWRALAGKGWSKIEYSHLTTLNLKNRLKRDLGEGIDYHSGIINLSRHGTIEIKIFEGDAKSSVGQGQLINPDRLRDRTRWGFNLLDFVADLHDAAPLAMIGRPILAGDKPTQKQIDHFINLFFKNDPISAKYARETFAELNSQPAGLSEDQRDVQRSSVKQYFIELGLGRVYERHDTHDGYDENLVEYFLSDDTALEDLARDLVSAHGRNTNTMLGYFPEAMHEALLGKIDAIFETEPVSPIGRMKDADLFSTFARRAPGIQEIFTPSLIESLHTIEGRQLWGEQFVDIRDSRPQLDHEIQELQRATGLNIGDRHQIINRHYLNRPRAEAFAESILERLLDETRWDRKRRELEFIRMLKSTQIIDIIEPNLFKKFDFNSIFSNQERKIIDLIENINFALNIKDRDYPDGNNPRDQPGTNLVPIKDIEEASLLNLVHKILVREPIVTQVHPVLGSQGTGQRLIEVTKLTKSVPRFLAGMLLAGKLFLGEPAFDASDIRKEVERRKARQISPDDRDPNELTSLRGGMFVDGNKTLWENTKEDLLEERGRLIPETTNDKAMLGKTPAQISQRLTETEQVQTQNWIEIFDKTVNLKSQTDIKVVDGFFKKLFFDDDTMSGFPTSPLSPQVVRAVLTHVQSHWHEMGIGYSLDKFLTDIFNATFNPSRLNKGGQIFIASSPTPILNYYVRELINHLNRRTPHNEIVSEFLDFQFIDNDLLIKSFLRLFDSIYGDDQNETLSPIDIQRIKWTLAAALAPRLYPSESGSSLFRYSFNPTKDKDKTRDYLLSQLRNHPYATEFLADILVSPWEKNWGDTHPWKDITEGQSFLIYDLVNNPHKSERFYRQENEYLHQIYSDYLLLGGTKESLRDKLDTTGKSPLEKRRKEFLLDLINGTQSVGEASREDGAMNAQEGLTLQDNQVGGINLDAKLLDLQIKRDANGVPLPLIQQPINDMKIQGFIPVIINIRPATNLPLLLGVGLKPKSTEQSSKNNLEPGIKEEAPRDLALMPS